MKTMHTGTDCQHTGDKRGGSGQGVCFKCQHPLYPFTMPSNRPLEALKVLLDPSTRTGLLREPWPSFRVEGAR